MTALAQNLTIYHLVFTVLSFYIIQILYKLLLRPLLQLRTYKKVPDTLIRYNIGFKTVWEYADTKTQSFEPKDNFPFLITEKNTLLLKYPNLKAVVSNFFMKTRIALTDHELTAELMKNPDNYDAVNFSTMIGKRYLCHSLICVSGNDWKRQRKIISKAFDFQSIQKIVPIIQEVAKELVENPYFLNEKEPQMLKQIFVGYTWEAFSRSFFGDDLKNYTIDGQPFGKSLESLMRNDLAVYFTLQYQLFGEKAALWNSTIRNHRQQVIELGKVTTKIIRDLTQRIQQGEMKNPDGRKGIVELLLENSTENEQLTTLELIANFLGFSFAGIDSTSNTLSSLLLCLDTYPQTKEKVLGDIQSHWDGVSPLNLQILNEMEYLHAFILETLRVMSPGPGTLIKIARQDHFIGSIPIKKGYQVGGEFSPTWFSPKWIKNPHMFQPERWIKGHEAYQQMDDPFVFLPFSAGARNCIGQYFGMTSIKIAACYFLTRFDFALPAGFKLAPMMQRAFREPQEPLKMFIKAKDNRNQ